MMNFTPSETEACVKLIELAFAEDFGTGSDARGDLTSAYFVPSNRKGTGRLVARAAGVIAGLPAVELVFRKLADDFRVNRLVEDGSSVPAHTPIATISGPMNLLLAGERTALNFVQHLSGIATLTRRFVDAVAGLPVQIVDTRKTHPGWRLLAKYAVRQGGGHNHRVGLFDMILVKDNHWAALGSSRDFVTTVTRLRQQHPNVPVEIEVENLAQLDEVLIAKPDFILLDNMPLDTMREAVRRRNAAAPKVLLEASGGVNLQTVRGIAETGVDRISVGALTHSAPALDIALDYGHGE